MKTIRQSKISAPLSKLCLGVALGTALLTMQAESIHASETKSSAQQSRTHQFIDVSTFSSVEEAVDAVSKTLTKLRFDISLVVNHQAAAGSVGLELGPTQVIYAMPPGHTSKRLLSRSSTIGIDLPLKFLIFENDSGDIEIRYNTIGYLIDRHRGGYDYVYRSLDYVNSLFGRPDNGLTVVQSTLDVDSAMAAIKEALVQNGAFRIPLEMDFPVVHRRTQKLIVFGNPNAGTPLMQADRNIALDLPQEILVVSNRKGGSSIIYNDPFFIADRYDIEGQDARLTAISGALANFAAAGSGN